MEVTKLLTEFKFVDAPAGYAEATAKNDRIKWASFVFTDDQPNENKQRVPKSEFSNIINSGKLMPVKSEAGNIKGDHAGSVPIGTIASLKEEDNKVIGLAALWKEEHPAEIEMLEEAYAGGEQINFSWELFHENTEVDADGISNLKGTKVRAITFVGNPAYAGRTNLLALAQKEETTQEENELTDTNTPDVTALETKIAELQSLLDAANSELQSRVAELDTASSELTSLREFKQAAEAEAAKYEKKTKRRNMLKEAGVDYTDEEFKTKEDKLMEMSDETFEFLVQERVAFSSNDKKTTPATAGILNTNIPDLTNAEKDPMAVLRAGLLSK